MERCVPIPRDLVNVDPPYCPGCAYGEVRRCQWRQKGVQNVKHLRQSLHPGGVISNNQFVSPTKGFVHVHRGSPTTKYYICATVFVNHYSDFTYTHFMTEMNAKSIVEAKLAFEHLAFIYSTSY